MAPHVPESHIRRPEVGAHSRAVEREYTKYGQNAYQRLATISVAHLY